ncbi:hypothetical protein [Lysinibacillus sp.]|uniref:hypothetical protein n=1 Tax=Lysinibacillus sp. TaxID=1869345 RepID=UPI00289E0905|nr:hypothetical protein [Lysinibacillus sp.]
MSLHVCNSVKSQSQFGVFGKTVYLTGVSLLTWIMYILCWDFTLLNEYDDKLLALLALLVFISSVIFCSSLLFTIEQITLLIGQGKKYVNSDIV